MTTFFTSPIQPSPTSLWTQFMYYIILYSFKHGPSEAHATYWRKLRKCGLEGMSRFLSDLLHEPKPCVLPSGQRTLAVPWAHREGLVLEISTPKEFLCSSWLRPNFSTLHIFYLKYIADSKWLALSTTTTKCRLQGSTMSRKDPTTNLGHSIPKLCKKQANPPTQLKQIWP